MHLKHYLSNQRAVAACVVVVAAALVIPAQAEDVGLGLTPMRTELRLASGASYTGTLRLVNEGGLVRVRTSLLDFHLDSEQTPQFEEQIPEETAYSCRSWFTVNPMETELANHTENMVRYTIRVPANVEPRSYYCAVGFTSLPPSTVSGPLGIRTAVRVVAAFYIVIGQPAVQGGLKAISLERVPGSEALRAVVVLENAGKMYFRPSGTVSILDPEGKLIETYDFIPLPILPERKQRLLFPLKALTPGQPCSIRVRVDLGAGDIQEGTVSVQGQQGAQ